MLLIQDNVGRRSVIVLFWAIVSLFAYFATKDQYPGYDASMMVNAGYQSLLRPYGSLEEFSPLPPLFVLGSAWSLAIFGISWTSFTLLGVGFCAVCTICFLQASEGSKNRLCVWISACCAFASTAIFYGFWWHNTVSAFTAAVASVAYFNWHRGRASKIIFVVFCALSFCGKVNVSGLVALILLTHTILPLKWGGLGRGAIKPILIVVCLTLVVFALAKISPLTYLESLILISEKRAAYTFLFTNPSGSVENYAFVSSWIALALTGFLGLVVVLESVGLPILSSNSAIRFKKWWIVCGLGGTAFFALYLNGDYAQSSLPLLFGALVIADERAFSRIAKIAFTMGASFLIVLLCIGGANRDRVFTTGPQVFWAPEESLHTPRAGFFSGSAIGPELGVFMAETEQALKTQRPRQVFFGPRVEFGYAAFKQTPPRGLPLWFDPRVAWPMGGEQEMINAFKQAKVDLIIFNQNDTTYMPIELVQIIFKNYVEISSKLRLRQASIWVKKQP